MQSSININVDIDEQIDKVKMLLDYLDQLDTSSVTITTITIRELAKVMHWSIATAQDCFNRPDFPACDFGKEKRAEINAVRDYFSVRRCRDE